MHSQVRFAELRKCTCSVAGSCLDFVLNVLAIENVVEYFRLEIFYGFVVCVVAVGSVCVVVVFLFCILHGVLVDSRIT